MFEIFANHTSIGTVLMFNTGPQHGEGVGEYGGDPLFTQACHRPNTKGSPRGLGSTSCNKPQAISKQEGERCGSVKEMSCADVAFL
jgi:hypothetical protein